MELREVVPWGRSFDEYRRMFGLTGDDLAGRVLGCGDGPASFNAEATAAGHSVISCDPIYASSAEEIERRVAETYDTVISQVKLRPERYVWDVFRDPDELGRNRLAAMRRFLGDFERGRGEGRYVVASLPTLPFADSAFDLAVVSHLLFTYSEHFDAAFHVASVVELLRVAGGPHLPARDNGRPAVAARRTGMLCAGAGGLPGSDCRRPLRVPANGRRGGRANDARLALRNPHVSATRSSVRPCLCRNRRYRKSPVARDRTARTRGATWQPRTSAWLGGGSRRSGTSAVRIPSTSS